MAFWQAKTPVLKTNQTVDYTPTGRTSKDDGVEQRGVVKSYEVLSAGQFAGTTTITVNAIDDVHANSVVVDKATGLVWSQNITPSIYGTGAQGLLWDDTAGNNEDIFEYCDQANLAGLSGFSDWRVPNIHELFSIFDFSLSSVHPDSTIFLGVVAATSLWSSTTDILSTTSAIARIATGSFFLVRAVKTTSRYSMFLVRGG